MKMSRRMKQKYGTKKSRDDSIIAQTPPMIASMMQLWDQHLMHRTDWGLINECVFLLWIINKKDGDCHQNLILMDIATKGLNNFITYYRDDYIEKYQKECYGFEYIKLVKQVHRYMLDQFSLL